jgi:pimeloyl-ACP methyl ester carboxylesterase
VDTRGVLGGCSRRICFLSAALALACSDDSRPSGGQSSTAADAGSLPALASDASPAAEVSFEGTWLGTLQLPPIPIRLVLHLMRASGQSYTGTVDSPDQGGFGIPITSGQTTGRHIVLGLNDIGAVIAADLSDDGQTLSGTLLQAGASLPITFTKQPGPLDYRRPQDPVPPFPYDSLEVTFPSAESGVTLAGTLLSPKGPGPFTTVVLITGSGAQNRNEELLNHRPFLVLADALARANIAVLRYDDRGVGSSTGNFAAATSLNFADDVRGAVSYLRSQSQVPIGSIGLIGHSEGGLIAPLVANGDAGIAFLVLLAGPAVDGATIIISQGRAIAAAEGATPAELDANDALQRALFACFRSPGLASADAGSDAGRDGDAGLPSDAELDACLRQPLLAAGLSGAQLDANLQQLESPWTRFFATYDPAPALRRTQVPVLALNGSLDLQVIASVNLPILRAALTEAGNQRTVVSELPGLNHLFQHATTGAPSEYGNIDETMAPEVLTQVADWIGGLAAPAP